MNPTLHELRVLQPYAHQLVTGRKTIEYRTYPPAALGPLLIRATNRASGEKGGGITNHYVGAVILTDFRKTGDRQFQWSVSHAIMFPIPIPATPGPPIQLRQTSQETLDAILKANSDHYATLGWFARTYGDQS